MHQLYRAVLRDIYINRARSLITFFTIMIVIAIPISMFSTAPSISNSINNNTEEYHLAHLDLRFFEASPDVIPVINNLLISHLGWAPERIDTRIYTNLKLNYNSEWYPVNTIGINVSRAIKINEIKLIEGTLDISDNQTVVLESFAHYLNLSIGDSISLYGEMGVKNFTIVGFVKSIEFLSYEFSQQGAIYITENNIRQICNIVYPNFNNILIYFSNDITKEEVKGCSQFLKDIFIENNISFIIQWQVREISISAALQDTLNLTSKYLNATAIAVIFNAGIVIYIITKRYAFEQKKQTGMLYSFGFSSSTLLKAFLLRTLIITIFSMVIGTVLGWFLLKIMAQTLATRWGILDLTFSFSYYIVIEVLTLTPLILMLFTYLAARENISMTPYEALRGYTKELKNKIRKITLPFKIPLQVKYAFRNLSRNRKRTILTLLAFLGAIVLSFSFISTISNLDRTQTDYFDNYVKWDVKGIFNKFDYSEEIYENISQFKSVKYSEQYLEYYIQPNIQSELLILLRGVIPDSQLVLIDLQEGQEFSNATAAECILNSYMAEKLSCKIGDNIEFWYELNEINVTVIGICRDLENPSSMFIQLPFLEEELGYLPVNSIVVSTHEGELDNLINKMNYDQNIKLALGKDRFEARIGNIIDIQTIIIEVVVILISIISFFIIFSTTFIITIERKREISLQRVFGFSKFKILLQLFLEMTILTFPALIFGFLGGYLLNLYWLSLISSIFFKIDSYFVKWNYLFMLSYSFGTIIISLIPEYLLLNRHKLAETVQEKD